MNFTTVAVLTIAYLLLVGPLDYLLWNRGQDARYKAIPRHRARGVFY